jgi:hypothetical protein
MQRAGDSRDDSRVELNDAIYALRTTIIRFGIALLVLEGVAMALAGVIAARALGE